MNTNNKEAVNMLKLALSSENLPNIRFANKTQDIFLTKDMVAKGDYGDNVAKHWDTLRDKQRQVLKQIKERYE